MHRASAGSLHASCWVAVLLDIRVREALNGLRTDARGPPRAEASAAEDQLGRQPLGRVQDPARPSTCRTLRGLTPAADGSSDMAAAGPVFGNVP
jgi:hypothetical protein